MNVYSQITEGELLTLREAGIKDKDLTSCLSLFCAPKEVWRSPVGKLNIMFYIDSYGDFMSRESKAAKIMQALFQSLPKEEQQEVIKYLMESEDDEES